MSSKEYSVYVNGKFYRKSEAKVSVYDHGLLYGDGIFEGIRSYDGVVFQLAEHICRLYRSARAIKLAIPITMEEMTKVVVDTLKVNKLGSAYIRLIVTRGAGDLGVDPKKCTSPTIICIAESIEGTYGKEAREKGIRVGFVSTRRDVVDSTTHEVKSLNYLNSILAKIDANEAGYDDAIMLDHRGYVSETPTANVFMVEGADTVVTPTTAAGILDGITRRRVMKMAKHLGFNMVERDITPYEFMSADEIFLTGTKAEMVPVVSVSGRMIGDGKVGKITKRFLDEFARIREDPSEGISIDSYRSEGK
ncbi:MAG: branched-chain-amino-acid transaminase [Promethearchaeati archaeon SRVP18_Atabeyarchaeia-1]